MTDFNSDVAVNQADPSAKKLNNTPQTGGNGAYLECIYTVKATEVLVVNDRIRLFELPVGFRPNAPDCSISNDGVDGTSAIVSIGTDSNADSIAGAIDITAAGIDRAELTGDEGMAPATSAVTEFLFMKFTTLTDTMATGKKIVVRLPVSKT